VENMPGRLCKLFDHKCIRLEFVPDPNNSVKRKSEHIKNSVLAKKCLSLSVHFEAKKILLGTLSNNFYYQRFNDEQKGIINDSKDLSKQIGKKFGELKKFDIKNANGFNGELDRERLVNDIEVQLNSLPATVELWNGLDSESHKTSFDEILTGMKVAALRWQKHLIRAQNLEIANLKNSIKGLNLNKSAKDYLEIENKLIAKQDLKLREQLMDSKISEVLGSEKPSKTFMEIAKLTSQDADLKIIANEKGESFTDTSEQKNYIKNFYENLYKKDETKGTIEDFLGAEICNSELVKNSKLTEPETESLDRELKIEELDIAMLKSNFKSAAGSDKLSNNFIKTFRHIIRQPLYDVSKSGLENNDLPDAFMTADIKLIPKKGDLTQIKNWRPISLLSNLYKIVSRAINIRLKKIAPRILSRAQKGFCPNKYMHEVIINSIERINYCNDNNISGVMISADLSKAFDSVSHEFMEKCYDFYRFGPRI
jgi:Reverse transcriptase (RNA-dependent DNA polymerase)